MSRSPSLTMIPRFLRVVDTARRLGVTSPLQPVPSIALGSNEITMMDAVTAYEMQNKFLNKEVLERNQLRQQAADREQKLFM